MDTERDRELIRNAQLGDKDAMEQLVLQYVDLIHKIANKYRGHKLEDDDAFQIGSVGFIKAVQKFDLESGNKLITYAYPLIHSEIQRFIRDWGIIRTSRPMQKVTRLIVKNNCQHKTPEEISKIIGINDIKLIKDTLDNMANGQVAYLSHILFTNDENEVYTLENLVAGDEGRFWDDNLALKEAIEQLDEREQYILDQRYDKGLDQHEVGKLLGISQVHVSRLERRALAKIREYLDIPLELPKVRLKVVKESKPKEPQGDRDMALHLLKTSTLSYGDIANMTGVPLGTMYKLGRDHRPPHILDIVKKRSPRKRGELDVYEA